MQQIILKISLDAFFSRSSRGAVFARSRKMLSRESLKERNAEKKIDQEKNCLK